MPEYADDLMPDFDLGRLSQARPDPAADFDALTWRTPEAGNGDGGRCIEYAPAPEGGIYLRDSEDPNGSVLAFSEAEFAAFVLDARRGLMGDLTGGI